MKTAHISDIAAERRSALSFGRIARDYFAGYYYYACFMTPPNRTAAIA